MDWRYLNELKREKLSNEEPPPGFSKASFIEIFNDILNPQSDYFLMIFLFSFHCK